MIKNGILKVDYRAEQAMMQELMHTYYRPLLPNIPPGMDGRFTTIECHLSHNNLFLVGDRMQMDIPLTCCDCQMKFVLNDEVRSDEIVFKYKRKKIKLKLRFVAALIPDEPREQDLARGVLHVKLMGRGMKLEGPISIGQNFVTIYDSTFGKSVVDWQNIEFLVWRKPTVAARLRKNKKK